MSAPSPSPGGFKQDLDALVAKAGQRQAIAQRARADVLEILSANPEQETLGKSHRLMTLPEIASAHEASVAVLTRALREFGQQTGLAPSEELGQQLAAEAGAEAGKYKAIWKAWNFVANDLALGIRTGLGKQSEDALAERFSAFKRDFVKVDAQTILNHVAGDRVSMATFAVAYIESLAEGRQENIDACEAVMKFGPQGAVNRRIHGDRRAAAAQSMAAEYARFVSPTTATVKYKAYKGFLIANRLERAQAKELELNVDAWTSYLASPESEELRSKLLAELPERATLAEKTEHVLLIAQGQELAGIQQHDQSLAVL